jgi:hypothetical protein
MSGDVREGVMYRLLAWSNNPTVIFNNILAYRQRPSEIDNTLLNLTILTKLELITTILRGNGNGQSRNGSKASLFVAVTGLCSIRLRLATR